MYMAENPTYEELLHRIQELERQHDELAQSKDELDRRVSIYEQSEQRLVDNESRYRGLFNYSNDGICPDCMKELYPEYAGGKGRKEKPSGEKS
jgi:DNA repair exonuclease SbcCD ATPase subunit